VYCGHFSVYTITLSDTVAEISSEQCFYSGLISSTKLQFDALTYTVQGFIPCSDV